MIDHEYFRSSYSELPWTKIKEMLRLSLENQFGLALTRTGRPLDYTKDTKETIREQGDQYH